LLAGNVSLPPQIISFFAAACRFNDRAGDAGGKIYPGGFNL
jgi:hypothetical protein